MGLCNLPHHRIARHIQTISQVHHFQCLLLYHLADDYFLRQGCTYFMSRSGLQTRRSPESQSGTRRDRKNFHLVDCKSPCHQKLHRQLMEFP